MNGEGLTPSQVRILVALLRVQERTGRATVREVAAEAGRSLSVTHYQLVRLRNFGLVAWTPGRDGTLRALVGPVPFGVPA